MTSTILTADSIEQFCATPSGARRFLQRATFGPQPGDVEHLMAIGPSQWFDAQIAIDRGARQLQMVADPGHRLEQVTWEKMIGGADQLRRRVAYALSQIFVVSNDGGVGPNDAAAYADLLEDHAFGDFREFLEAVTLSPAMSRFLSLQRSRRANPDTGASPDENYAREVMQLFTIGLWELGPDGTRRLRDGMPVPTYGLDDVIGLARALTGWVLPGAPGLQVHSAPLVPFEPSERRHESGEKSFLGVTIPANTPIRESLRLALDRLAAHPNVGPFIGRQLIQRLVTSNPSPEYVARVAATFDDDGTGRRGNLEAVVRSVLTDPDTFSANDGAPIAKLREPVLRFTVIARALGLTSAITPWPIGRLEDPATALGQQPYYAPSVFNFYRPDYAPASTEIAEQDLAAPEMQIASEASVLGWINWLARFVNKLRDGMSFDIADLLALASDPVALVGEVGSRLCPEGLSPSTASSLVESIAAVQHRAADVRDHERVMGAVVLIAASTDFLIER